MNKKNIFYLMFLFLQLCANPLDDVASALQIISDEGNVMALYIKKKFIDSFKLPVTIQDLLLLYEHKEIWPKIRDLLDNYDQTMASINDHLTWNTKIKEFKGKAYNALAADQTLNNTIVQKLHDLYTAKIDQNLQPFAATKKIFENKLKNIPCIIEFLNELSGKPEHKKVFINLTIQEKIKLLWDEPSVSCKDLLLKEFLSMDATDNTQVNNFKKHSLGHQKQDLLPKNYTELIDAFNKIDKTFTKEFLANNQDFQKVLLSKEVLLKVLLEDENIRKLFEEETVKKIVEEPKKIDDFVSRHAKKLGQYDQHWPFTEE